jgi:hypothetical protein
MNTIRGVKIMATVLFFDISESAMKWGAVRDGEWISGDEAFFPITQRESRLEMTFRELDPLYGIEGWDEIRVAAYPHMHDEIKGLFGSFGHSIVLYNRFSSLVDKDAMLPHMHMISFDMEQCYIASKQDGEWQSRSHKGYGVTSIADCLSLEEEYDHPKYQFYTPLVSSAYYKMLTCNQKMGTVDLPGMQESIDLIMEYSVLYDILNDKSWIRIWNSIMLSHSTENWQQEEDRTIVKPDAVYIMGLVENEQFERAIQQVFMERYGQEVQLLINSHDRILSNLACYYIELGELGNVEPAVEYTSVGPIDDSLDESLDHSSDEVGHVEEGKVLDAGRDADVEIGEEKYAGEEMESMEDIEGSEASEAPESTEALEAPEVESIEALGDMAEMVTAKADEAPQEPVSIVKELEQALALQKRIVQEVRLDDQFIHWGSLSLDWIEEKQWSERHPQVLWIELPYPVERTAELDKPFILLERLDELKGMEIPLDLEWWKGPVAVSFTADFPSEPFPMREMWVRQSIHEMLEWSSQQGWDVVGLYAVENVDWIVSALYSYLSEQRLHTLERIVIQPELRDGQEFQAFTYMMKVYEQWPTISLPEWREKDLQRLLWVAQGLVEELQRDTPKEWSPGWKLLFHAILKDSLNESNIARTTSDAVGLDPGFIFERWYDEVKGTPSDPSQATDGMYLMKTMSILECWVTHVPQDQHAIELLALLYQRMEMDDRPLYRQVLEAYSKGKQEEELEPNNRYNSLASEYAS